MSQYQLIDFKRTGARADLVLKRPPRNTLNVEMLEEMISALEEIRDDESLKVLVIKGNGLNFCGGVEVNELTSERVGLLMPLYTRTFDYINDIRGVVMQLAQSSVGKTLLRLIMRPPMLASFSASTTRTPWSAASSAACMPAMPAPTTNTSDSMLFGWSMIDSTFGATSSVLRRCCRIRRAP